MSEMSVLLRALDFAAGKHRAQRGKDAAASPYINHPIAVAEVLARVGRITDVAVLAAAVLHDTVEKTATTPEEIELGFGAEVRAIVEEVTDDKTLPEKERKELQIEHAAHASVAAKLVKLGDKICNVIDVSENPASTKEPMEYLEWSERVVDACRGTNAALEAEFDAVLRRGRERLSSKR